ncbi:MAG TPA: trehalose-phosphatase [Hyphomicrobiaceae bacterium]|jgi:trehalose 6-phosphate phosphatase|nr:trehalose-phosphatase [Hyphomicrobiaceae bacterium]
MMQDIGAGSNDRTAGFLADPQEWALFIDIDGTLLDVAATPDAVHVPQRLARTLKAIVRGLGGAVALSTGRRVSDADRLFAPLKLVTSGVHGTEVRTTEGGEVKLLAPMVASDFVQRINEACLVTPGILVEQKGAGIAVHYRNAPEAAVLIESGLERLLAGSQNYVLRPGRKVVEILPKGYSKGTSLDWVMRLAPFHGRRPIMVGDDDGDEPGIRAAERLGGFGLKVAGEHFSQADSDFDSAADVRAWLGALARRFEPRDTQPLHATSSARRRSPVWNERANGRSESSS